MSSPVHHPEDLDAALRYAPPWARNTNTPGDPAAEIPPIIPSDDDFEPSFDGDRAVLDLQHRLSLDPDELPEPPVRIDDRPTLDRIALRLCAVAGLAALVAWLTISLPINFSLPINMSLPFKPHIDEIVRAAVAPAMTATPIKVVHIHTPIAPLALVSTQPVACGCPCAPRRGNAASDASNARTARRCAGSRSTAAGSKNRDARARRDCDARQTRQGPADDRRCCFGAPSAAARRGGRRCRRRAGVRLNVRSCGYRSARRNRRRGRHRKGAQMVRKSCGARFEPRVGQNRETRRGWAISG